ncbi:MAG: methyltransferase [Acidobacteriia bacterium]|nr:methyltransferase [Terriglobia bacterium]
MTAFRHREPDRVPVDLSGHRSSGMAALAYVKLRKHLGLAFEPPRVYDSVQQLAIVDPEVLDLFGVDTIELGRAFAFEDEYWADWVLPDGTPCQMPVWALPERAQDGWILRSRTGKVLARMPDGAVYFEQCYFPFAEADGPTTIAEAFDESMWAAFPNPPGPLAAGHEGLRRLAEGARSLRASTDRAIIGQFGGSLFQTGQILFRNDIFLMLLAAEPARAHDFLDRLTELHLSNLERFLGAVGQSIDIIVFSDDLGMQTGPFMSRRMYREFFKPRHSLMWRRAKRLANVKVMLHTCGGIRELIPDLLEAGVDAVNPVQTSCQGMDSAELKAEYGRDLVFWGGGCDTQTTLSFETAQAVKRHVHERLRILSPGGGFVFQQVHNILANVPPENIVAMFESPGQICA